MTITSNPINIIFAVNKKYIPYLGVTIASILRHSSVDNFFKFYIISCEELNRNLECMVFADYHNFDISNIVIERAYFNNVPNLPNYITMETYLRLLIPKIFRELDLCIYIDVDLVLNQDITELCKTNLDNFYLGAVIDYYGRYNFYRTSDKSKIIKKYGLKNQIYINAGVLLFNLKAIRENHAENLLMDTLINYARDEDIKFGDQDIINIAFNGRIKTLDPRWNVIVTSEYRPQADCFVIHWAGSRKPWNWPPLPFTGIYLENARITPFYELIITALRKEVDDIFKKFKIYQKKLTITGILYKQLKLKIIRKKHIHYEEKIANYWVSDELKKIVNKYE